LQLSISALIAATLTSTTVLSDLAFFAQI